MKADRKNLSRKGLSAPILALILVVVGVAFALIAASIAGGFLFGWGTAPKVTIERVDILVDPVSGTGFITVDVRNSGGARLTSCAVTIEDPSGTGASASPTTAVTDINPGQMISFSDNAGSDFQSGAIYVAVVTCTGPGAVEVIDKKSAVAHI